MEAELELKREKARVRAARWRAANREHSLEILRRSAAKYRKKRRDAGLPRHMKSSAGKDDRDRGLARYYLDKYRGTKQCPLETLAEFIGWVQLKRIDHSLFL